MLFLKCCFDFNKREINERRKIIGKNNKIKVQLQKFYPEAIPMKDVGTR